MINEYGQEVPDDTPVFIEIPGMGRVNQLDDVKRFIDLYMSQRAAEEGMESLDEANDFDVEDDMFPLSAHEYSAQTEAADREALLVGDPTQAAPPPAGGAGGAPPVSPPAGVAAPPGPPQDALPASDKQ